MKKILMSLFILLMFSVSVFAANGNGGADASTAPAANSNMDNLNGNAEAVKEQVQLKLSTRLQERLNNQGLQHAMINVQNANAQDRLTTAMEKIESKNQERLQALNGLVISEEGDEAFVAEGQKQSGLKYLSFVKFERSHRYQLYDDGTMLREQTRYDWLFEEE
jgi:hypothetical protein